MKAEPMLELEDVEIRYGAVPAVRALSLDVHKGEIVGLIGPNGAGKTTTLLGIMGAVPVRSGDIRLGGESICGRRPERIVRSGIALVPEGRRIFADFTVRENLRLGLVGRKPGAGEPEADVEWVLELFPIVREFWERPAGALSGGQQQQLAIGRALVARPDVLLLDEPSLGLAPKLVDAVFEVLLEIRDAGVSVLLVEQRARRTVALADRTYVMTNGEVRLTLTSADADDTERIIAAYLGI
jgi:branched-chain amino acid transport system ATP-binding protein